MRVAAIWIRLVLIMRTRRPALGLLTAMSLSLAACGGGGGGPPASDDRTKVVAGFYPLAEAAARVGGDSVVVTNLTPPGTEPHDLELSSRQVDAIEDADLVLYLGFGFQPAAEEVARAQGDRAIDVLASLGLAPGSGGEEVDPHFWLDPTLMAKAVEVIERAIVDARPADRESLVAAAGAFTGELEGLDTDFEEGLRACDRQDLVTSHAAFHYLATRYGLRQESIAGLSPESEPEAARLAELADLLRRTRATTVFYETLVPPEVAQTLAREVGAKTAVLNPIEGRTEGEAAAGATYLSLMRENLAALRSALGCR